MTWLSWLAVGLVVSSVQASHENLRRWRADPVTQVVELFGAEPDRWQAEALRAFANPSIQRISLQACAGPGKTAVLCWCGWNFLSCYGEVGEHPKGAAVSVTRDNLRDNLWAEFSKWQQRSAYLREAFVWQAERIFAKDHPQTWFLAARSWPKTASPDEQGKTLSGIHGKYLLYLVDESGSIPTTVGRAGEQGLATRPVFGKMVQSGNPITLTGMLYAASSSLRHLWHVIRITGDPDDPMRSPRIDLEWAKEQIRIYGRDNPWVKSYILGEFPPTSPNALLGPDEVNSALGRVLKAQAFNWSQKRLGIDVSRFGDDRTVIFPRQGLAAKRPIVMKHDRDSAVSVLIANKIMDARLRWGSEQQFIDASGPWAMGTIDVLRAANVPVIDVQFGGKAHDSRYENRRAELWFRMSEWVKRGAALPHIPEIVPELTETTYQFSKSGKFLLEPKEQVKKRIGSSPDLADALACTFGLVEMPSRTSALAAQLAEVRHTADHDFDPNA